MSCMNTLTTYCTTDMGFGVCSENVKNPLVFCKEMRIIKVKWGFFKSWRENYSFAYTCAQLPWFVHQYNVFLKYLRHRV